MKCKKCKKLTKPKLNFKILFNKLYIHTREKERKREKKKLKMSMEITPKESEHLVYLQSNDGVIIPFTEAEAKLSKLIDDMITDLGDSEEPIPLIEVDGCLLYTSPSPRDGLLSRMPSSA